MYKLRTTLTAAAFLVAAGLGLALIVGLQPVRAGDPATGGSKSKFVGSKKCKKCHSQHFKSWGKTAHGEKAFDVLKANEATDVKGKFNLDPTKDYTTDASCLKCHATGYGFEGGYTTPDPDDKKSVRKAKSLQGVGCESCHGPGSAYLDLHKEIQDSKRTYKVDEMYTAGMNKIEEKTCSTCHNEKSPTIEPDATFDFEKMKEKGVHEHIEMKQREE